MWKLEQLFKLLKMQCNFAYEGALAVYTFSQCHW